MISVPAKPSTTSAQRRRLTGCLSHSAATSVIAIGVIATIAVNSASGR